MKLKVFICLLSFVAALYLLEVVLHRISPDRENPKDVVRVIHEIPEKETPKETPPEQPRPSEIKEAAPRMVVVQNVLPANLAAAMAASEEKPDPPEKKEPVKVKPPPPPAASPPVPLEAPPAPTKRAAARQVEPRALEPETIRISREHSAIGASMQREGVKLPVIEATWRSIGFDTYLKMMKQVGGHIYVGDTLNQSILGKVELHHFNNRYRFLRFLPPGMLDGLALFRPREIADEPLVNEIMRAAIQEWSGSGSLAVVMLLPTRVETGFLGSLKQYLEANAHAIETFGVVRGEYFVTGNGLGLEVKTAVNRDTGQAVNLGLKIMI